MNIVEELRNKKSRDNRELLDRAADRIEELELLLNQNKSNNFDGKSNNEVEEMTETINDLYGADAMYYGVDSYGIATTLYNAGYRKQSENVVEFPCKVGTTLYFLYNSPYADKPDLTPRIYKTADWYFEVDKTGIVINTSDIHSFNKKYDYYLGETAFLTKQEAEQALAKMKGGAE